MSSYNLEPGDTVIIECEADMWYKGVPGLLLHHAPFVTTVLVGGRTLDVSPSALKVISRTESES